MLFTDAAFLFYFLPCALVVYRLSLGPSGTTFGSAAATSLFLLTLVFYGFREPWWLVPFFLSVAFDCLWAQCLGRAHRERLRFLICAISVAQNLSLLALFKYWPFVRENIISFVPESGAWLPTLQQDHHEFAFPAGISFYTFESMSFVIDVYRRVVPPPTNPLRFFAFIGMFPRFVAGPIVRYRDVVGQFVSFRGMQLERGLFLFLVGLFLKACFADSCANFTAYAFDVAMPPNPGLAQFASAWIGVLAYTFQLYLDFSGYSLMAIGLGLCLGFHFPRNFDRPYLSRNLQEFWRRWHISLSSWLRDYLYIPLGGNRGSWTRTQLNLFLTMLLGGLWHGAGWTFLIWGAWHGAGLALTRKMPFSLPRSLAAFLTFLFVTIGWVFFRAKDLHSALAILRAMFLPEFSSFYFNARGLIEQPVSLGFALLAVTYCFVIERRFDPYALAQREVSWGWRSASLVAAGIALLAVFSAQSVPFLYFRF